MDFEMISQEGSFGRPQPKFLKLFCSAQQDGRKS